MSLVVNVTCQPVLIAPRSGQEQCESLVPSHMMACCLPIPEKHHGHQDTLEIPYLCPCCWQEHQSEDASRNKIIKSRIAYQPSCWISDLYLERKWSAPSRLKSLLALGAVVVCKGCSRLGLLSPRLCEVQLGLVLHVA